MKARPMVTTLVLFINKITKTHTIPVNANVYVLKMSSEIESACGNFCCTCKTRDNEADTEFQSISAAIPNTDRPISDLLKMLIEPNIVKSLPSRMCGKCVQRIRDVHEFQQMYLRAQSKYRQLTEERKYTGGRFVSPESLLETKVEESDPLKEDDCTSEENMEADGREDPTQDQRSESSLSSDDDFNCPSEEEKFETESNELTIDIQTNNRTFECDVCGKTFRKVKNLADHKRVVHPPSVFVCSICGKGYKSHGHFVRHMLVHKSGAKRIQKPPEPVTCEICNKVFSKSKYLKAHKRIHTKENNFLCKKSEENMEADGREDSTQDQRPKSSLSSDDDFNWPSEEEKFETESKEVTIQTKNRTFKCDVCCKTFKKVKNLADHKRVVHPPSVFVCSICGKGYKAEGHFIRHKLKHKCKGKEQNAGKEETQEKDSKEQQDPSLMQTEEGSRRKRIRKPPIPKTCEICHRVFSSSCRLNAHKYTHSEEKKFLCKECGKAFKCPRTLAVHENRHVGVKQYECPFCPKKFKEMSNLSAHKRIHSDSKPHVCDVCGAAFKFPYSLKKHKLYHSEKSVKCEQCDMRFYVVAAMRRHMLIHTGEKPYKCKYCEQAYNQSGCLMKHMRNHVGNNVYRCELCPMGFHMFKELRDHFALHKNDDEATKTKNAEALADYERSIMKCASNTN